MSLYNLSRDIKAARDSHDEKLEDNQVILPGVITSEDGEVVYTDLGENFTWVSLWNRPESKHPAYNPTTIREKGTPVLIKRNPKGPYRWEVVGINDSYEIDTSTTPLGNFSVSAHAENHQVFDETDPGSDPMLVGLPMMYMLKTVGDGVTLSVITYPYTYVKGGSRQVFYGASTDLTSYVPGAGLIRKVLIYLNKESGSLALVSGAAVTDDSITPIPEPAAPSGTSVRESALVELANGQTTITTATQIEDMRDFLDGGQGSAIPTPTAFGQFLVYDDGGLLWGLPVISEDDAWMVGDDDRMIIS